MRRTAVTLAIVGMLVLHGDAQPSHPIYVVYDGFVKNQNGTMTLAFGYYNFNHASVTIQPGPDNGFTPGSADRNQPITFLEGRHRFTCTMVVPRDFDGKIQWTVKFAGNTSTTTPKVLDPLYELEELSEKTAMAGLDLASAAASSGNCTNRAPSVQVSPASASPTSGASAAASFTTRVDRELTLNGSVDDDGLPRGSKLAIVWRKNGGPGEATFSDHTVAATSVRFSAAGEYELELSATDTARRNSARVKVTVEP